MRQYLRDSWRGPLSVAGELKIVASDDLGGLGAKDGPPVMYSWTPSSLMPLFLPWLAVLSLLMLKPNRSAQAWWVWLALGIVCGLGLTIPGWLGGVSSELGDILSQLFIALAFGWCALWLLAPSLSARNRFLTAVGMFLILAGFSLFTYLAREDWGEDWGLRATFFLPLALMGFALVLALSLAGFACRHRFTVLRFLLYLTGSLLAAWTAILLPFFAVALFMGGGGPDWTEFAAVILVCTGISLGSALPFLALCLARPFFGDRLRHLLLLPSTGTAPQIQAKPAGALNSPVCRDRFPRTSTPQNLTCALKYRAAKARSVPI